MSSEWQELSIDELKADTASSIAIGPFGSRMKSDCYVQSGVSVIRGTNLTSGREFSGDFVFITPEKAQELGGANLQPDDLVFPHRGSIGEVGIVPNDGKQYVLSSSLMKLKCDMAKANPLFIYYFFKSSKGRAELLKNTSQVGTPGIGQPLTSLKSIRLRLPDVTEQERIANFLCVLDDRIALLRETNTTLEAIAQALFKSWFVDFDPVHAKQQGRVPEGMDEATAALFPDSFEESELGIIPKGWLVGSIGTIAEVIDCLHAKKPELLPEGRPFLQLNNIRDDGLLDTSNVALISPIDYNKWISRIEVREGDCVITNVGRVGAVAQIPSGFMAAMGRNMTAIRVRKGWPYPTYLVELLQSAWMRQEIERRTDVGTILNALNVRNIPMLTCMLASHSVLLAFESICRPIRAAMEANLLRAETLATLRDTLLPRLISGQLRLPQAEEEIHKEIA